MLATVGCTGPDMALELQNKPAPQARNHPIAAAAGIAKPVDVGEPQPVVVAVDSEDQVIQVRQANPVDVGPRLFPEPVHCLPVRRDQGQKRLAPTQSAPAVKGVCIPMRSEFHQAPARGSSLPGQLHIGKQSLTGSRNPHLGVCQGYFLDAGSGCSGPVGADPGCRGVRRTLDRYRCRAVEGRSGLQAENEMTPRRVPAVPARARTQCHNNGSRPGSGPPRAMKTGLSASRSDSTPTGPVRT